MSEPRSNPIGSMLVLLTLAAIVFSGYLVYTGRIPLPPPRTTVAPAQAAPQSRPFAMPPVRQLAVPQAQPPAAPAEAPQTAPVAQPAQEAQSAPEQPAPVQVQREVLSIQQVPADQPDATPVEVRRVVITTTNQPGDEVIVSDGGSKRKAGRP